MASTAPGSPCVIEVQVADATDAWERAGFAVDGDRVAVGEVSFRLVGGDGRGIVGWTVANIELSGDAVDGLSTRVAPMPSGAVEGAGAHHPNGVVGLDHIVVSTPDLARTIDALAAVGIELRRIRETESYGAPMRQAFFRLGPTVLEVVSGEEDSGESATEAPATWFGLAFDVDDLDETATLLGDALGQIKVAVQPGRRIATFRHKDLGLSVATAAMDHHGDR